MVPPFTKDDDLTEILQFSFLNENGKVTKSSCKSAFTPPYPLKYYVNVALFIFGLIVFLLWNYGIIPGNKIGFYCKDPLFSHEYRGDTVTEVILWLGLTFIFPLTYFVIEFIRQNNVKEVFTIASILECYVYGKQFVLGLIIVGGLTEIAKTIVGEHRPHFFYTCMPDANMNCSDGSYIFDFTCTNTKFSILRKTDASRSFPSGHSSMSWFAASYCAYVVHSRLPIHRIGSAFKIFLLTICMTFSLTCSLTRITDRRHHWWDVLAGTLIGILGAAYVISITHLQVKILYRKIITVDTQSRQQIDFEV